MFVATFQNILDVFHESRNNSQSKEYIHFSILSCLFVTNNEELKTLVAICINEILWFHWDRAVYWNYQLASNSRVIPNFQITVNHLIFKFELTKFNLTIKIWKQFLMNAILKWILKKFTFCNIIFQLEKIILRNFEISLI